MISVVCSSQYPLDNFKQHIIKTSGLHKKIEFLGYENTGQFSLTEIYNRGLKDAKNDIVVFVHHDVEFDNGNWGNKLIKHFNENPEFGILGLAGTTDMDASGRWWTDRSKMVGIVNHEKDGKKWESRYSKNWGDKLNEVVIVDGLFFAVHKSRIKETFDETVEGFHFYEINFVFSNYIKGVKVGVMYNIRVTHKSIGETNEQWELNRLQFIEKYKDELPKNLVPDFYKTPEFKIEITPKIRLIIQYSDTIDNLKNLHQSLLDFNYPNLKISLISDNRSFKELKDLALDSVSVFEGYYDTLAKNISLVKLEAGFTEHDDELILLMNDKTVLLNNMFNNSVKIYSQNKKGFGCVFPLSYNADKTIFCSKLELFMNKEGKVAINMKDIGTYYNVYNGNSVDPIGNLSDCILTTKNNLISLDWLNTSYDTPIYFNEFALKLFLRNKNVYTDSNSLTIQKSFTGQTNIQEDFQKFISFIGSEPKLQKVVKLIK